MDFDFNGGETKQSFSSHLIEFIQTLAVFAAIAAAVYNFAARPHKVSGPSMHPTFKDKDYIFTDLLSYRFKEPERGDMIVFKNPRDDSQDFIKRVIAVPGDKIKIEDHKVYLNDHMLEEPYLDPSVVTEPKSYIQEGIVITVEPNHYVVLGDNRTRSSDSREFGPISKDKIIGKVFFRYWPVQSFGLINH